MTRAMLPAPRTMGGRAALFIGLLAFLGLKKVKKIKKPEQTIASLDETKKSLSAAVKSSS